jgi:putative aminopeptidase FrvX
METGSFDFLKRLLDSAGPSGFETAPAKVWREEAAKFADEVEHDVLGSSYAWLKSDGPTVVVEGHIDEIGFQISHIDEQGFIWFGQIGGTDDQVLVGQRMRILAESGDVIGVIGRKAAHLLGPDDRDKAVKSNDLWIDIGVANREEALERVALGDPIVIDAGLIHLHGDRYVSRAMDNRTGAFVALETLRLLNANRPWASVVAVAAAQEEVSYAGAYTSTFRLAPLVAIALDVTHATDYPGGDKQRNSEVALGGGPVLCRGASLNPVVFKGLKAAADRLGFTCPVQAAPRQSFTDADAMIRTGAGTATGLISFPNRYMHSPNEVISLRDLEQSAQLIAEFIRNIGPDSDFRP